MKLPSVKTFVNLSKSIPRPEELHPIFPNFSRSLLKKRDHEKGFPSGISEKVDNKTDNKNIIIAKKKTNHTRFHPFEKNFENAFGVSAFDDLICFFF